MAYEYASVGTQRFDRQGYIGSTDPNYAIKIFSVLAVGSLPNAALIISSLLPGSTATNITTPVITVPITNSSTNASTSPCTGFWDSHYGILIPSGAALFHTFTGFQYGMVTYMMLSK